MTKKRAFFFIFPSDESQKWLGLALNTPVLFGYSISSYWRMRGRWWFWALFSLLVVGHVTFFVIVLKQVRHWPLIWFALLYAPESLVIDTSVSFVRRRLG